MQACCGSRSSFSSGMVVLFLAVVWALQISSVQATIGHRYGGAFRRPIFYGRPNVFHGQAIPSPTHTYPIFSRPPPQQLHFQPGLQQPPVRFPNHVQPPQQQYARPPVNQGFVPMSQPKPPVQPQPSGAVFQHTVYYPNAADQRPSTSYTQPPPLASPSNIHYGQPAASTSSVTYYRPTATQQQTSGYYPSSSPTSGSSAPYSVASSNHISNYYPQSHSYYSQSASGSSPLHFHLSSTSGKPYSDGSSSSSGTTTGLTYEPCTSSHWQPVFTATAVSATQQQPSYFYGGSITTAAGQQASGPTYFRYQPESSHKVVVLSHDVLKALLANSKSPVPTTTKVDANTKAGSDNIASASSTSSVVSSNSIWGGSTADSALEQPSVRLVGYIGPATDNTPTGYLQVPISKQMMETLSGSGSNYDFAINSSSYSLFTLKSVNDVQSLFGILKSNDNEASASIPLGLVVSADGKTQAVPSEQLKTAGSSADMLFYPVASNPQSSSGATSSSSTSGGTPGIQVVGHVQVTSPDISSHFNKREDLGGDSLIATA